MPTIDELKETLRQLTAAEQLELADWLYQSADHDNALDEEWYRLAEDRIADLESGKVQGILAEEVFRALSENRRQA
ncbi:addiction module protein [Zavarzinella formosa]|uniref:addiction module protein n=1 Tax=Zavarzinella formosa TaxID=360055 RepID=UPI0002E3EC2A|nr:addiction module protein [Zavarzinella formosa]